MSLFGLFSAKKPPLRMAVDVGSHAIKALLFEAARTSEGGEKSAERFSVESGQPLATPKVVKKLFFKLPVSDNQARIVAGLQKFLFATVKELERIPEKIVIAIGPNLADETLSLWTIRPQGLGRKISRRKLGVYFQNLFEANRDSQLASLVYPVGLSVNGYAATPEIIERTSAAEIGFKTLTLSFPETVGAGLTRIKQSFGGLPIEFIPLAAALKEAIIFSLGLEDAFLVDVGGEETTLILLKSGEVLQIISFAPGAHHFLRGLAKISGLSLEEAESKKRQYIQGLASEKVRSQLQEFFRQESEVWKKEFLAKLDYFYHLGPLPPKILLFGGGARLSEIAAVLRGTDWLGNFSYTDAPEVKILDASNFFQGSSLGGFLQGPEDAGLASLIINSFHHESYW